MAGESIPRFDGARISFNISTSDMTQVASEWWLKHSECAGHVEAAVIDFRHPETAELMFEMLKAVAKEDYLGAQFKLDQIRMREER
jgi:hypothetical protein